MNHKRTWRKPIKIRCKKSFIQTNARERENIYLHCKLKGNSLKTWRVGERWEKTKLVMLRRITSLRKAITTFSCKFFEIEIKIRYTFFVLRPFFTFLASSYLSLTQSSSLESEVSFFKVIESSFLTSTYLLFYFSFFLLPSFSRIKEEPQESR